MYILSAQRELDVAAAFKRYREYLDEHRAEFPPNAFSLASSDWWFNFNDHRSPHDAWLQKYELIETGRGDRSADRSVDLKVELLGAFHDCLIRLEYDAVSRVGMSESDVVGGFRDWRYDEFRAAGNGDLIHEIEWAGPTLLSTWVIQAKEVRYERVEIS